MYRKFAVLTGLAVWAVVATVFWLATYMPATPAYSETNLTQTQRIRVANTKSARSVVVLKTDYTKPIYVLMERGKEAKVTFDRPEWVAPDGSIVLTEFEKIRIVEKGPAQMPPWMFWQTPETELGLVQLAVAELMAVLLLFTAIGGGLGVVTAVEPKVKGFWVAALVGVPLVIAWLRLSGGMDIWALSFLGPSTIGIAILAFIGWTSHRLCQLRLLRMHAPSISPS